MGCQRCQPTSVETYVPTSTTMVTMVYGEVWPPLISLISSCPTFIPSGLSIASGSVSTERMVLGKRRFEGDAIREKSQRLDGGLLLQWSVEKRDLFHWKCWKYPVCECHFIYPLQFDRCGFKTIQVSQRWISCLATVHRVPKKIVKFFIFSRML